MRFLASVITIDVFLVFITMSDKILASPINAEDTCHPVVHKTCGTWCENNCEEPNAESLPCDRNTCRPGYYCKPGYVKEMMYGYGRCILPSECPNNVDTTVFPVTERNEDTTVFPVTERNEDTTGFPVTERNEDTTGFPVTERNEDTTGFPMTERNEDTTGFPVTERNEDITVFPATESDKDNTIFPVTANYDHQYIIDDDII